MESLMTTGSVLMHIEEIKAQETFLVTIKWLAL